MVNTAFNHTPFTVDLNHVRAHVEVLKYVKQKQAELKELEDIHRAAIEEALGDNEIGELDGKIVVTWRHGKARRFNQSQHKSDQPGCHEIYTQANETRTFRVES